MSARWNRSRELRRGGVAIANTANMTRPHELRCYDYVNRPYAIVRDALRADPYGVFNRATTNASSRAKTVTAQLHVEVGDLDIAADVVIQVGGITEREEGSPNAVTTIELGWTAARSPGLFPAMRAQLRVFPLSATETQLELCGSYEPPLGILGSAIDRVLLHRIADASVLSFVKEVAQQLRGELPAG
jgi:hypothetical protein